MKCEYCDVVSVHGVPRRCKHFGVFSQSRKRRHAATLETRINVHDGCQSLLKSNFSHICFLSLFYRNAELTFKIFVSQ